MAYWIAPFAQCTLRGLVRPVLSALGAETVFVGSGIFKSSNPQPRADAIVQAVTHYQDPVVLTRVSKNLGEPMVGINCSSLFEDEKLSERGV